MSAVANNSVNVEEGKQISSPPANLVGEDGQNIRPSDLGLWVSMKIKNLLGNTPIDIKEATIDYGRFYPGDDKHTELDPDQINHIVVAPSQTGTVSACGTPGKMAGTEGGISLYEGSTKICQLHWDCPYWKTANDFNANTVNPAFIVTVGDWSHSGGAIGTVYIEVERADA